MTLVNNFVIESKFEWTQLEKVEALHLAHEMHLKKSKKVTVSKTTTINL